MAATISMKEFEADLVVAERLDLAEGVIALDLRHPDGGDLPAWTPGAHIDLVLGDDLTRQYSLCSSPRDRTTFRVGVLLDPGSRGGSRHIHEQLHAGDTVGVRGPRNAFKLVASPRYQFIAGGIGVTPMLAMIEAAEASGAEWSLLYGGRQVSSMAFCTELAAHGDRVQIRPEDEHGLLDLPGVLGTPREDTLVYCCGPEPLLNAVERACSPWPAGSLHIERFTAKPVDESAGTGLDSFEVVCQQSGITVTVPADRSIYEVLDEAGINVMASCEEGICGTCEATVLEGEPLHRDSVLSPAEQESGLMITCVSRCTSPRLVLDL